MRGAIGHVNSDWLDLERDGTVLCEHRSHHVDHNVPDGQLYGPDFQPFLAYSLVLSVAVVSMKMFFVLPGTIFESTSSVAARCMHMRLDIR